MLKTLKENYSRITGDPKVMAELFVVAHFIGLLVFAFFTVIFILMFIIYENITHFFVSIISAFVSYRNLKYYREAKSNREMLRLSEELKKREAEANGI